MRVQNGLLFDEHPIVVNPKLASAIGLNEAIIVQQLHYWLNKNEKSEKHFHDGRYWTYNTFDQWHEQFPFWSVSTIKRTFSHLERVGIILTGNYNKNSMDRTVWYSIDYDVLDAVSRKCQNDTMHSVKMTPAIPETNYTETNSKGFPSENVTSIMGVAPSDFAQVVAEEHAAVKQTQRRPYTFEESMTVFRTFFEEYERRCFRWHPELSRPEIRAVLRRMPYFGDGTDPSEDIDPDTYPHLIEAYFDTSFKNCDYSIMHFMSGAIRKNRYHETN